MSPILVAVLSVGMPLAALGLYDLQESLEDLQESLERWEYERHADD